MAILGVIVMATGAWVLSGIFGMLFALIIAVLSIAVYSYIFMLIVHIVKYAREDKKLDLKKLMMDNLNLEKIKPVALTWFFTSLFTCLWSILLIIPWIWKSVQRVFSIIISIDKWKFNADARKESEKMVNGKWWLTFGYIICGSLAVVIISYILKAIFNDVVWSLISCILSIAVMVYIVVMYFARSKPSAEHEKSHEA